VRAALSAEDVDVDNEILNDVIDQAECEVLTVAREIEKHAPVNGKVGEAKEVDDVA
jgi:hypothetical protein